MTSSLKKISILYSLLQKTFAEKVQLVKMPIGNFHRPIGSAIAAIFPASLQIRMR